MGETRHKGRGWALHWALHVRDGDETDVHWRLPCDGRAWRTTSWRTFHRTIYIIRSMLSLVEVRDDALRQPAKAGAMTASLGAGESDMGTAAPAGARGINASESGRFVLLRIAFRGSPRAAAERRARRDRARRPRTARVRRKRVRERCESAVACARPRV